MQKRAWQSPSRNLRAYGVGAGILALVVIVLAANVYRSSDRTVSSTELSATLRGVHALQGYAGTTTTFAAALPNGEVVLVSPPVGTPFHQDSKVVLIKHTSEHGHQSFSFKSYAP